jgi:soluble lytic murein transglycosylase-like protein
VEGGVRHLRSLLDRFGDLRLALAAYNAGENLIAATQRVPKIPETEQYVARITALYAQMDPVANGDRLIIRTVENAGIVFSNF